MTKLFISYSRKDIEFVRRLTASFDAEKLDYWIDWKGIEPTVDWWREIEKGIERADNFLFLISPDSAASGVCRREIEHAVKNGKRMIPVVVRDIRAEEASPEIGSLNWIFLREGDNFQAAFEKLTTAIKTDYAWAESHRELQVKALQWERSDHESSLLLRGKELRDAESQLATNSSKEPYPTDLQRHYVLLSRQSSDRQRRITMGIAVAGVIALAVLAVYGFVQAGRATQSAVEAQNNATTAEAASRLADNNAATAQANAEIADQRAKIARAGELVTLSMSAQNDFFSRSLLLSVEAIKTYRNPRTETALLNLINTNPHLVAYLANSKASDVLAFHPDHKTLLSVTTDGKVMEWEIDEPGHPVQLTSLVSEWSLEHFALSPDGKLIASANSSREITLWDITNTEQPSHVSFEAQHDDAVAGLAFSPDGKLLASGSYGHSLILWEIRNAALPVELCNLADPDIKATTIAFSPDGQTLASTGDKTIILWDVIDASCPVRLSTLSAHSDYIQSLAFSRDGRLMASGGFDDEIILWDITDPANPIQKSSMPGNRSVMNTIAFSPDGQTLAAGFENHSVVLWDIRDPGVPIQKNILMGHTSSVSEVIFSPDGQHLVSDGDEAMILWEVEPSNPLQIAKVSDPQRQIYTIAFHPTEKILAARSCKEFSNISGCTGDEIVLWNIDDPAQPKILSAFSQQSSFGSDIAFSPSGLILAAAGCATVYADRRCTQGNISLWEIQDPTVPKMMASLPQQGSGVSSIAFRHDGKILASAGCKTYGERYACIEGQITLWNIEDAANPVPLSTLLGQEDSPNSMAFSPDGNTLASQGCRLGEEQGCIAGEILLWDVHNIESPELITTLFIPFSHVGSIAFSPDRRTLAFGGDGAALTLWDIHDPRSAVRLSTLAGHSGYVYSIAFSPNSQYLVSGSCANYGDANFCTQGEIILWGVGNPANPAHLVTLLEHGSSANTVAFGMSSASFASASDDGSLVFWDIEPSFLISNSCKRAGRNLSVEEWAEFFPGEPYRMTCPDISVALDDQLEIAGYSLSIQDDKTASAIYEQIVREVEPSRDPSVLNQVCWYGGIDGYAELVLPLCDRAVDIANESDRENVGSYRDSRGLVRALTGNVEGAIEDFLAFVKANKRLPYDQNLTRKREEWILALQSGENPFTEPVLLELRTE